MTTPEDREQELRRKELEIQAREQEIRLKELETQIYQEQRQARDINSPEPPLYETKKHKPSDSSLQKFTKKLVKFGKFTAFVVEDFIQQYTINPDEAKILAENDRLAFPDVDYAVIEYPVPLLKT
jgi:hypothetical protein